MSGAVIAAASAPCAPAGVINERREDGADMVVEDEVYAVKLSLAPIYLPCPDFEFCQTSACAYITRHPIRTPLIFHDNLIGSTSANDLGPWAEVLKGGILLRPVTL